MLQSTKNGEHTQKSECSPKNPSLDNKAKFVRQKSTESLKGRIWKMRNMASEILTFSEEVNIKVENKYPRICLCGRFHHNKRQSPVIVAKGATSKKAFYSNLVTCGSVWRCPVCSYKITKVRQVEVFKLLSWYQDNDYNMSFLTLTMRHSKRYSLKHYLSVMLDEFRKFQRLRKYASFSKCNIGMIKALEITCSDNNGWHPHLHIIFVHKKGVSHEQIALYMKDLLPAWANRKNINGTVKNQVYKPVYNEEDLSDYITKWDSSKEITQGNMKTARGKSRTAFGILSDLVDKKIDDYFGRQLFLMYHSATKGRNHLIISKGIRAKYKELNPDSKEDWDIVKDELVEKILFCISAELWAEILKKNIAPHLLNAYDFGGFDNVLRVLSDNGIPHDIEFDDDMKIQFLY